jgi:hypothetical protein
MARDIHDTLRNLRNEAKVFGKYIFKPYSSIVKNDLDTSDTGNYFAPIVRNLIGAAVVGTTYYIITRRLPEIPLSECESLLLLDTLTEGSVVTFLASAIKKRKK